MNLEGAQILLAILGISIMLGVLIWAYDEILFKRIRNATLCVLALALIRVLASVTGLIEPLTNELAAIEHFETKARLTEIGESDGTTTEDLEQSRILSHTQVVTYPEVSIEERVVSSESMSDLSFDCEGNFLTNDSALTMGGDDNEELEEVESLSASAFAVSSNSALIEVSVSSVTEIPENKIGIQVTTNIVDSANITNWIQVAEETLSVGATNCVIEVAHSSLPSDWDTNAVFYRPFLFIDSDGDGICDFYELTIYNTNPYSPDSDGDNLPDGWEVAHNLSPSEYTAASYDSDNDGVPDIQEFYNGTNPNSWDSDGDNISDADELANDTDPNDRDTDGDGLWDDYERLIGTNPRKVDSDGDGLLDPDEVASRSIFSSDPMDSDSDDDGLDDCQEWLLGLNPLFCDSDHDGISDYDEWIVGSTDPNYYSYDRYFRHMGANDYSYVPPPHFRFSHQFNVSVNYYGDLYSDNYSVCGIPYPGGTATKSGLDFENQGPNTGHYNKFEMTMTNGQFRALHGGRFSLRLNADDWAKVNIASTNVVDSFESGTEGLPGPAVVIEMEEGHDYPVSAVVTNLGGRAKLEFSDLVKYARTEDIQLNMDFDKAFVMCSTTADEPMTPEKHVFLRVSAEGGTRGGALSFFEIGTEKLERHDVSGLTNDGVPFYVYVEPFSVTNILVSFKGKLPSTQLEDVKIIASYRENDTTRTLVSTAAVTVVKAQMYPDYNRDGMINDSDRVSWIGGKVLRHWINENAENGHVDGVGDMMNFTPMRIDVNQVLDLFGSNYTNLEFRVSDGKDSCSAVWTQMSDLDVGSFVHTNHSGCGVNMSQSLSSATVRKSGEVMDASFVNYLRNHNGIGVFLTEWETPVRTPLKLSCKRKSDNAAIFSVEVPISISNVEEMYYKKNLRHVCGDNSTYDKQYRLPSNIDYDDTTSAHFFFLHGANVSLDESKEWFSHIFKSLWCSKAKIIFHGVTWRSNQGSAANYHQNVCNAFTTAASLASYVNSYSGPKFIMAHSLGNMVVSSAIQDHGMSVTKFFACNSAVPSEAYYPASNTSIRVPQLVHPDWESYPTNSWASNWHKLFANDPTDGRRLLGWPGRFEGVLPFLINFFSTQDEVLELYSNNNIWLVDGIIRSTGRYAWHKQEINKGRGGLGGTSWSGWSIRKDVFLLPIITSDVARNMTDEEFKISTVFNLYPTNMYCSSINRSMADECLARGIPSLVCATGVSSLSERLTFGNSYCLDVNIQNIEDGVTPVGHQNGWHNSNWRLPGRWLHSDIKDVPFYYTYQFYEIIKGKCDGQN